MNQKAQQFIKNPPIADFLHLISPAGSGTIFPRKTGRKLIFYVPESKSSTSGRTCCINDRNSNGEIAFGSLFMELAVGYGCERNALLYGKEAYGLVCRTVGCAFSALRYIRQARQNRRTQRHGGIGRGNWLILLRVRLLLPAGIGSFFSVPALCISEDRMSCKIDKRFSDFLY